MGNVVHLRPDPLNPHPSGCHVHETLRTDDGRTIYVWNVNSDCAMLHPMELDADEN